MQITVRYTTQLKAELGHAEETMEVSEPCRVRDVLRRLSDRYGAAFRRLAMSSDGELLPSMIVCVNDQQTDPGGEQMVRDGDAITLVSAISGG